MLNDYINSDGKLNGDVVDVMNLFLKLLVKPGIYNNFGVSNIKFVFSDGDIDEIAAYLSKERNWQDISLKEKLLEMRDSAFNLNSEHSTWKSNNDVYI